MQRLPTCGGQVHLSAARTTPFDAAMQRLHGGSQSNKVRPKKLQCKSTSRSSKLLGHTDQAAHINKPKLVSTQLVLYLLTHPALAGVQDIGPLLATAATSARRSRGTHSMQQSACSARRYKSRPYAQARGLAAGAASAAPAGSAGGLGCVRLRHTYMKCRSRPVDSWLSSVRCATSHGWKGPCTCGRPQAVSSAAVTAQCWLLSRTAQQACMIRQPGAPAPAIGHSVTASWHERFAATEACQVTTWLTGPVAASHARTPSDVYRSLPHTWTPESSLQLPPLSLPSDCSPSREVHSP